MGAFVTKATNEPRFEDLSYIGLPGVKGLLMEGARTNLLGPQDMASGWAKSSATVTANYGISPDGTKNSQRVVFSVAGTFAAVAFSFATGISLAYATSFWMRGTGTVHVDMSNGTGLIAATLTGTWTRYSGILTSTASPVSIRIISYPADTATDFEVWAPSCELGAFPSSTIIAPTSPTTRNAETLSRSVVMPADGFTMVVEAILPPTAILSGTDYNLWQIDDGTLNNRHWMYWANNGAVGVYTNVGGVNVGTIAISSGLGVRSRVKIAASFAANSFRAAINGVLGTADTSGAMPTGLTTERFGNAAAQPLFGHVVKTIGGPTRWLPPVPDAMLQKLSAP